MNSDLYAVVGHPISHSKSPRIHSLFAAQTGEPVEYIAIQAPLDEFGATVTGFFERGGKGLNVTVPFKEEAWGLARERTSRAAWAGAANTLYQDNQGRLVADNTDGVGLVTDLVRNHGIVLKHSRILMLGAGGAVRGVLGPLLAEAPARLVIANRTLSRAEGLVELFARDAGNTELGVSRFTTVEGPFDLIINGTSASLQGDLPPLPTSILGAQTRVYDMMYSPEATTFNQWARAHGATITLDGLGMLVEQAAESFYVWRGVRPDTAPVIRELRAPLA